MSVIQTAPADEHQRIGLQVGIHEGIDVPLVPTRCLLIQNAKDLLAIFLLESGWSTGAEENE